NGDGWRKGRAQQQVATLVGNQKHVKFQLEQRAHEQNQVPAIDTEKIQEHGVLALDQDLIDDRGEELVHPVAAAGKSRTWCAMSAAKRSSLFVARRKKRVPGAPIAR